MPCSHQRAQQMRELFAQLHHIMAFCLEELQQRAQMRCRKRRPAAVEWPVAVHELVYPATEIVRGRSVEMRLMMQFFTRRQGFVPSFI